MNNNMQVILLSLSATVSCLIFIFKVYQKMSIKRFINNTKMENKVVIVTGSNTGIGYATAASLAKRGAKVILACRNPQKGLAARDKMVEETENKNIIFRHLDLTSFDSVRYFADEILRTETHLDVLINNAGTGKLDNSLTRDNLPIEAQVNHFSPFLLTMLLLPLLRSSVPSRIINVSSLMHKFGTVECLDRQAKNSWQHRRVYSNTKLANVLFTRALSVKLRGTGITVNCLHPGAVSTDMFRHQFFAVRFLLNFLFLSPNLGAQTSIFLAVSPSMRSVSGKYFSNCTEVEPAERAEDPVVAEKLWKLSEEKCSIRFEDVFIR